jgi:xanthine dehydrogenase small subunit
MKKRDFVLFYLNGERHEVRNDDCGLMLSEYLRSTKNLTGTKIVCAEGDCGSCSVLRYFPYSAKKENIFLPINSCIATVAQMDGSSLITVEALGFNPVQKAMANCHGSQCGFEKKICTKKMNENNLSAQETKNALTGNLCRCTGYQPIIDAAGSIDLSKCESVNEKFLTSALKKDLLKNLKIPIDIKTQDFNFIADIKHQTAAKSLSKKNQLLAAATDLGVVHNKRKMKLNQLVSLHLISDLYKIKKTKNRLSIGARVTFAELRSEIKDLIPEFAKFLDLFASPQIKNIATLVGNVATASPIADTPPFLLTMNTIVEIQGPKAKRKVNLESFVTAYRKIDLKPNELITALHFDIPKKDEVLKLYKVSQRKDMDISAINFALRLNWKDDAKTEIKDIKIAVGGVAATTLRLYKTEKFLINKNPNSENIAKAVELMHEQMTPLSDLRATDSFRHVVAENLFYKFFREMNL